MMRTIAQISDLHFGAHEPTTVAALETALVEAAPDLVVVSGDLTQRARTGQFREADAFLRRLEASGLNMLVVPGNHDVPLHNLAARLLWPLRRYRRIVARGRSCWYSDPEIAVLGLASAHGLTIKDGRLTQVQIRAIADCFAQADPHAERLLVTHHPLVPLPGEAADELEPAIRGARRALRAVRLAGIHLVLAGHNHAHTVEIAGPTLSIDPQVMVVQAGTATSWRRRGTPNSFNLLRLDPPRATIEEWISDGGAFSCRSCRVYARASSGWSDAARRDGSHSPTPG